MVLRRSRVLRLVLCLATTGLTGTKVVQWRARLHHWVRESVLGTGIVGPCLRFVRGIGQRFFICRSAGSRNLPM